jgi:hypothetical protein
LRIHKTGIFLIVLALVAGSFYYVSSAAGALPQAVSVAQTTTTTTTPYCVYQTQFLVVEVNTLPGTTQAGASLKVVFKVEYADGTPATLNPELANFLVLAPGYSHAYLDVPVTPTGTPGEYQTKYPTSIILPSDIPMGTYKLYCIHCMLTDGKGNFAPNSDISSDETAITTDDSIFTVGAAASTTTSTTSTTVTTAPPSGFPSTFVLLALAILIIILIAALLLRRPKK